MEQKVVLEMRGINKNFSGVGVLQGMDSTLREGEIHALMDENGTGRSALIEVLTGVEEFGTSIIQMEGSYSITINRSPQGAQENDINTIYQKVNLRPDLSVTESLYISRRPKKGPMIDWGAMEKDARKLPRGLDIHIDVTMVVENYSIVVQQMIAIIRVVDMLVKVLALDEPTSSLDDDEAEKLFVLMRQLKVRGIGVIFVTHLPEQIYAVCGRITVLRNGTLVGESKVEGLPRVQLVARIMGKGLDNLAAIKKESMSIVKEDVVMNARELGCKGIVRPFDLDIRKDEVISLTGLLGSGRSELIRTIYSADKPDSGELTVKGKKLRVNMPIDTMTEGMAYLPGNRKEEGIITDLLVQKNIIIALQARRDMFRLTSRREQEEFTDKYTDILQIGTANRETPVKQPSNSNQQRVTLGHWLLTNSDFLILDEPIGRVDIGTKTETQRLVLRLAEEGTAVVFISSEIEEMFRTCNRTMVMRDGEKVREFKGDELSQDPIMRAVAGGEEGWWGNLKS